MSDFTRQSNTDFNRQPNADFTRNAVSEPARQPNVVNEPPRPPRIVNDPAASRPTPVARAALTTSGPLIGPNDIAAFIAAAVMVLGPLAGGAFWTH